MSGYEEYVALKRSLWWNPGWHGKSPRISSTTQNVFASRITKVNYDEICYQTSCCFTTNSNIFSKILISPYYTTEHVIEFKNWSLQSSGLSMRSVSPFRGRYKSPHILRTALAMYTVTQYLIVGYTGNSSSWHSDIIYFRLSVAYTAESSVFESCSPLTLTRSLPLS